MSKNKIFNQNQSEAVFWVAWAVVVIVLVIWG